MLGKRSRPVQKSNCKFDLMSDNPSDCVQRPTNKSSAFFNNSRLLIGFSSKGGGGSSEGEGGGISPTSPLDIKNFCAITTFWQDKQQGIRSPRPALEALQCGPRGWEKRDSEGVGLGIVAALHNTNNSNSLSPKNSECRVSSANKVKILVGSGNHQYPVKSSSPRRQSQPIPIGSGSAKPPSPASKSQEPGMEYSESYTCITSHGPKLVTKQIYADETLERDVTVKEPPRCKPAVFVTASPSSYPDVPMLPGADFLSACYLCRRPLHQGKDIYMYSGDKAFCSVECRYQQIAIDEGKERRKHNSCSSSPHESYYHGKNRFAATLAAA